jgi:drug/metabolite transporter (DMT)-like permease
MGAKEWAMLLALSALWGGSFFFIKVLVEAWPPFTVVLGRVGLAAVGLNLLLLIWGDAMPKDPRLWRAFFFMGLLNNVAPFSLIVFGEMHISSGLASILNATTPIFTVLAAHVLTSNEKLSSAKAIGVLFGFAGVAALVGPNFLLDVDRNDLVGETACLLAAVCYAFASIYGRRFKGVAPLKVATGQVTASAIVLLPIVAAVDKPWTLPVPGVAVWLALAGIAFMSTALAFILYFRILATAGATNLALVTFLLPASAMALGFAFLGETVTPEALIGLALIGLGLAAIDGRLPRRLLGSVRKRRQAGAAAPS